MKNTNKVKKTITSMLAAVMMMTTAAIAASADNTQTAKSVHISQSTFEHFNDYRDWAENVGYNSGYLTQAGVKGINGDQYLTLPDSQGYTSGNIVRGDSRCCHVWYFGG